MNKFARSNPVSQAKQRDERRGEITATADRERRHCSRIARGKLPDPGSGLKIGVLIKQMQHPRHEPPYGSQIAKSRNW